MRVPLTHCGARGECRRGWGRREALLLLLLGAPALKRRRWNARGKWDRELVPCGDPFRIGTTDFFQVAEVGGALDSKEGTKS